MKGSTPSIFARMECATKPGSSVVLENVLYPGRDSAEAMDCSNIQSFDAVPEISESEEKKKPVDCTSAVSTESAVPTESIVPTESAVPTESDVPTESHGENSHEPMVPLTIEELIELNQSPVPGWAKQNIRRDNVTNVVFSKAEFRRDSDAPKTFPLKEVIITSDLSVHVNILNNPWSITDLQIELGPALTLKRLQNLLLKLDELKVCSGSKFQTELDTIYCRIANKDIGGTWRHVQCSLLLTDKIVCTFCQRVQKTVARKIRRTEIRGQPKRIHLRLSSKKNKTLSRLRDKLKTVKKATRRAKNSLSALKSKLDACQEKLNS